MHLSGKERWTKAWILNAVRRVKVGNRHSARHNLTVRRNNAGTGCPKIMGIHKCVSTWQLLPWQPNWVRCPCRCLLSVLSLKDRGQGEEFEKKRLGSTPRTLRSSFLSLLFSHTLLWISARRLRAPPCGSLFSHRCSHFWMCGLCTGAGLDRKPRRGFSQQTHRCGKIPAPSPSPAETARGLWGSGTGSLVLFLWLSRSNVSLCAQVPSHVKMTRILFRFFLLNSYKKI